MCACSEGVHVSGRRRTRVRTRATRRTHSYRKQHELIAQRTDSTHLAHRFRRLEPSRDTD